MGTSSPSPLSRVIHFGYVAGFIAVFLGAIFRMFAEPNNIDRCESLLRDGWWIDSVQKNWQPASCMLHNYKETDITQCLGHSRVVYIGDSIVRTQYIAAVRMIQNDAITEGPRHSNRKFVFGEENLTLEFWWDPYLNTTQTIDLLGGKSAMIKPSLLILGSGLWHMRYLEDDYFPQWQSTMDYIFNSVKSRHIADATVLSPIEIPKYDQLSKDRLMHITPEKISKMNEYLEDKLQLISPTPSPFAIPFVWNKLASEASNVTKDGLHYNNDLVTVQAQIALNYRCNNELAKHFPMDSTCCNQYPRSRWYQSLFFIFFLIWIPFGYALLSSEYHSGLLRSLFPSENVLSALFVFGLCVIMMYMGDRTQLLGKIHKHYDPVIFTGMIIAVTVLGLSKLDHNKKEGDLGYLNRHQTDEWKGWMQLIILVYHYCGASSVSGIYNAVRILVGAYLFQTGYGHFFFFYKKADYGIGRILNVMVRLNLLTFVLQYLMDTDYLSYYFTPLVSLWFMIIWVIMYAGHKWNRIPVFILSKMAISCVITTVLIKVPGILEFIFGVLETLFNIHWSASEWRFRLGLDAYIVYVGMLTAYGYIKIMEHKLIDHPRWSNVKRAGVILSALSMVWYFWYELSRENKFVYNGVHPYISWIPIIAFTVLRNTTHYLRNTHSHFFAFIGKISLETFIGQFHIWLAADTKGLLVVLSMPNWMNGVGWWVNLMVSTFLFLVICYYTSQSTQVISGWICKKLNSPSDNITRGDYQVVPLLPTNQPSSSQSDIKKHLSSTGIDDHSVSKVDPRVDNDEEVWESTIPQKKPEFFIRFINDTRVKTVLLMVAIGLLNNLC
ncbi:10 TM acyl transferase domain found in Cas1p-domain-containing protein [Pilobolus umbonatus]|nr:10 TM acyl transferase domain found in Cas1p-domain-containing protein [Pilobolus umbonatus]